MKTLKTTMLLIALINLTGCQTTAKSVIPQTGPTMENVYDSLGNETEAGANPKEKDLKVIRAHLSTDKSFPKTTLSATVNRHATDHEFRKIADPELQLYVFPHLAGNDEMPVPGYTTALSAYDHDHYALPSEQHEK